jgi:adenine phosphoribosyltransferase
MKEPLDPESLKSLIRDVPDFPQPGIVFRDITPLLRQPEALNIAAAAMASEFTTSSITHVMAIESRGFLFGPAIADQLQLGFSPIRKPGKLPGETISESYGLEYGTDTIEIQADVIGSEDRILLVDDVLATGGTLSAAERLVTRTGAEVAGATVLIELDSLNGREQLGVRHVAAVIHY